MSERPLVSVICPTWQRHDLLFEMIENVRAQTYSPIEVVIVSDGPDPVLAEHFREAESGWGNPYSECPGINGRTRSVRFVECGRHWTGFLTDSYVSAPAMVGQMLARGEYQCFWSDDERALDPEHLDKMVALLEAEGVDFVYGIVEVWWKDRPDYHRLVWADRPMNGHITHWLYRPSMIEKAGGPYRTHVGRANDWNFIARALAGGATWAFLPEITFQHRSDVPFT